MRTNCGRSIIFTDLLRARLYSAGGDWISESECDDDDDDDDDDNAAAAAAFANLLLISRNI